MPLSLLVAVEIKRPTRKNAAEEKNPTQQCLYYVKKIRAVGIGNAMGADPTAPGIGGLRLQRR